MALLGAVALLEVLCWVWPRSSTVIRQFHLSFQNGLDLDSLKHTADGNTQRACLKLSGFLSDPLSSHSGDDYRDCFWHTAQQCHLNPQFTDTSKHAYRVWGYGITMSTQDLSLISSTRLGCMVNKLFILFPPNEGL